MTKPLKSDKKDLSVSMLEYSYEKGYDHLGHLSRPNNLNFNK